jgi:hypothetical protein
MFENLETALTVLRNYEGKFFLGKVINSVDPEKLDRVKVNIPHLFDDDEDPERVPWCAPIKFSPMGQGDGYGVFGTPPVGADVLVIFQEGNPHYPFYWSIQTTPSPLAPGDWGWKDKFGNQFVAGEAGISLSRPCGASFTIDKDCKVTLNAPAGFEINGNIKHNGNYDLNGNMGIGGTLWVLGKALFNAGMDVYAIANFIGMVNVVGPLSVVGAVTTVGSITNNGSNIGSGHIHAVLAKDFGVTSPPL